MNGTGARVALPLAAVAALLILLAPAPAPAAAAQCFGTGARDLRTAPHARETPIAHAANVSFCGGPVMHSQRVHVIFWAPAGSRLSFEPGYEDQIDTFLARVAAADHSTSNVFGLMGQYHDAGGPAAYDLSFAGAVSDADPLPTDPASTCAEPLPPPLGVGPGWTACVDDSAIEAEIGHVIRAHGLPSGINHIYLLVTPNGFGDCIGNGPEECALGGDPNNGYCGYHSATGNPGILYAVIPYNAVTGHCQSTNPRPNGSTADPTISTIAHEVAETATDPTSGAWSDASGNEIADLCITNYGPILGGSGSSAYDEMIGDGHYYIQELWSNYSHRCEAAAQPDALTISAPRAANGDRTVRLLAHASDPQGTVVAYTWTFGDGHGGHGQQVTHSFLAARAFTVGLRITDSWGNWAFASQRITIRVPPRPIVTLTAAHREGSRAAIRFDSNAVRAKFECRLDGGLWVGCRSPFTTQQLAAGAHHITVRARDTFGQLGRPARYAFTVA